MAVKPKLLDQLRNKILMPVNLPVPPHGASSHTENAKDFPASCLWKLEAKLAFPISQFKNRRWQAPATPIKTLRHSSPPFRTGYSGAVFIKNGYGSMCSLQKSLPVDPGSRWQSIDLQQPTI